MKNNEDRKSKLLNPHKNIKSDFNLVYKKKEINLKDKQLFPQTFSKRSKDRVFAILGAEIGDEGKGRIVDNLIQELTDRKDLKKLYIIRFQGGGNAGHTIEAEGVTLKLNQVPSGILNKKSICVMDSGMVVNPEFLMYEVKLIEEHPEVGDTTNRLVLSERASMTTSLEEAEEVFNRLLSTGSMGGTGRGISPTAAHRIDRTGFLIRDLLSKDWKKLFGDRYDRFKRMFAAEGLDLKNVETPDYDKTKRQEKSVSRKVGTKQTYLKRLEETRKWLMKRQMVRNVTLLHYQIANDQKTGVIFEGAQAVGLHPWLGTYPDVSSTDMTRYGILYSTGVWMPSMIDQVFGIFKATYTSSVGRRKMPTEVNNRWAKWVREEANEYGTTTGRPRDILYLDLPLLTYNANMGGLDVLAATHLDIAKEGENIKICTHYTDSNGNFIPYQPDLKYLEKVKPHYIEVPGWDGKATREAKSFADLPLEARQFLAFIQRRTGFPIVAVTTGPARENYIDF